MIEFIATPKNKDLICVAVGASAGGLKPLCNLLSTLPHKKVCYIVAMHLSPSHVSHLDEILPRYNPNLDVVAVKDGDVLEAGKLYLPSPNSHVEVKNHKLVISTPSVKTGSKPSIDKLFSSIATDFKKSAIGIVLSGNGSDGSKGAIEINGNGGTVIVQSPDCSQYTSMPTNCINTNVVDFCGNVDEIKTCLQRVVEDSISPANFARQNVSDLTKLLQVLSFKTKVNFTQYKTTSIERRIGRRMAMLNITNIDSYRKLLESDDAEAWALYNSIFVIVSEFYRDAPAFNRLANEIAKHIESKSTGEEFRIWIPGCATGEEVYTFAMLIEDINKENKQYIPYKIIASDLSQSALTSARNAVYDIDKVTHIPKEWPARYFDISGKKYTVKKEIREQVIFASHDILADPAFSKLDLISCRNLLIYFDTASQKKLFETFSYALNDNGLLFLGLAEACNNNALFQEIDSEYKLYRRSENAIRRINVQGGLERKIIQPISPSKAALEKKLTVYKQLFESFSIPIIVIDENEHLVFTHDDCSSVFSLTTGFVEPGIYNQINPEFRPEIRALIFKSKQNNTHQQSQIHEDKNGGKFRIEIRPLSDELTKWRVLSLHYILQSAQNIPPPESSQSLLQELDSELSETRESLQVVIEELESSNEQLQLYNQELQSANEEFQSTNEELQTVNEELQSTNEELITVNEEYTHQSQLYKRLTTDLNNIQESTQIPIVLVNLDYRIQRFTTKFNEIFNTNNIGSDDLFFALDSEFEVKELKPLFVAVKEQQNAVTKEVLIENCYYNCQISPYLNEENKFSGYTVVFYNTNDIKTARDKIAREQYLAQMTLETIMEGVIRIDKNLCVQYANPISTRLTGWSSEEMQGQPINRVLKLFNENNEVILDKQLQSSIDSNESFRNIETGLTLKTRRGVDIFIEISFSPLKNNGSNIGGGGVVAFRNVTDKTKQMKSLMWNSTHDPLTGLINRKEMENRIDAAILTAKRNHLNSTLLYMDLDQFKIVNDTCGHEAGDILLQQISQLMGTQLRSRDTLARLGGDEFAILLEKCPLIEAESIALKLQRAISDYKFYRDEQLFRVGVSIGIVEIDNICETVSDVLRDADSTCYMAKDNGRNCIQIHSHNNLELEEKRNEMNTISRIAEGIDNDHLRLYFQEIIDTEQPNDSHWEVLVRMYDPVNSEFLLPAKFLPTAERYGLIDKIDLWVLKNTFKKLNELNAKHAITIPKVHLNVSGATLNSVAYINTLERLLKDCKTPPDRFCIEMTETAAMGQYVKAIPFMEKVKEVGCKIALDDFGRGMSSLSYLKELPIDTIKIDKSFVRTLANDAVSAVIMKSVKEVSDILSLDIIAEGVEIDSELEAVKRLGITLIQGFYFSKPIPYEEFSSLVHKQ